MIRLCPRCLPLVRNALSSICKQQSLQQCSLILRKDYVADNPAGFLGWAFRNYVPGSNDANTEPEGFGKLAERKGVTVFKLPPEIRLPKEPDEGERPKPRFFSKFSPHWYFLQCKRLAKEGKTKECLEFFEERMLKEDGVFPEESNYSVVIGALGRTGQAGKAFQLYRQMRDRGIQPSMATYTGLFNSVAQSPDSKDLRRATALYVKLHKNKIRMNRINYNSLIKVYGRHGTTEQMMGIFRESITAGFEPDSETFNMILLSLLKDKKAGFRKAIEVWRQMLMLDIKPDGKSIVYLLKVLKNCGIGDPDVAYRKLIQDSPNSSEYKDYFKRHIRNVYWLKGQQSTPRQNSSDQLPPKPEIMALEPGVVEPDVDGEQLELEDVTKNLADDDVTLGVASKPVSPTVLDSTISFPKKAKPPNVLQLPFDKASSDADRSAIPVQINRCDLPSERLSLIGGHKHVLDMFEKHDVKPTVMVLSSLLQVMPNSNKAEKEVIEFTAENKLKLDADFFNSILRKRIGRGNYSAVKEILSKMVALGISPNYRTWCISALGCVRIHEGISLVNEAVNANVQLDHIFFNSLINAAIRGKVTPIKGYEDVKGCDYRYLARILLKMKEIGVKVDRQTIALLEVASDWPEGYERWKVADTEFEKKVFRFRNHYNNWLEEVEVTGHEK